MQMRVARRRENPAAASAGKARGSALLLTLFTIAALLTLGTTFIAIAIGESRQTRGDKEMQLARGVAMYGINWITSYMALPTAWSASDQRDEAIGYTDKRYFLRGTDSDNKKITWLGRTADLDTSQAALYKWRVGVFSGTTNLGGTLVRLPNDRMVGVYDLQIERLAATTSNNLSGQPTQYAVTATAYIFRAEDANAIYTVNQSTASLNTSKAAAVRRITMRIRPQNPLDFAIYEANMRSWNIPGFNTQFGLNNRADNGLGVIDPSRYTPDSKEGFYAQFELETLKSMYSKVQLDTVGIPKGYQMKGNFRVDGSVTAGDPFASVSGSVHVLAQNANDLDTIRFTGSTTSFGKVNGQNVENKYDGSFNDAQKNSIFSNPNGATYQASRGLPAVADYMTGYVADTSNWPSPDPNDPTSTSQSVSTASVSKKEGWAAKLASPSGTANIGYVKVATPPEGAVPVNASTMQGADIEIEEGGSSIQQPGFARVKVTFNKVGNEVKISVQKVGAYSGKPVNTTDPPFDRPYSASEFPKGMLYVDGGNVEVEGTVPSNFTVVAAASSDRPTVATPATRDSNGTLVPQSGLPVLITPTQQSQLSQGTGIYRSGDDAIFVKDAEGQITNIPAYDPGTKKYYWPAYDPTKIGTQAGTHAAVTSEAPLVREGNVSIVGDLKKEGTGGSLGIVAQNYILLSDQSADANKNTLQVDAVLMSMHRSVQYGGFTTATSSNVNAYYQAMAVNPDGSGNIRGSIPRPRRQISNGTFKLNGSIIGQYADVESTVSGTGYTKQSITQDSALRSSMPPLFPNFSRDQMRAPIVWVVVAVGDSASTKSGTVSGP